MKISNLSFQKVFGIIVPLVFISSLLFTNLGCALLQKKKDYSRVCKGKDVRIRGSQRTFFQEEVIEKLKNDIAKSLGVELNEKGEVVE